MDEYKIMFDSIYNVPEDIEEVKDHLKDYKWFHYILGTSNKIHLLPNE